MSTSKANRASLKICSSSPTSSLVRTTQLKRLSVKSLKPCIQRRSITSGQDLRCRLPTRCACVAFILKAKKC